MKKKNFELIIFPSQSQATATKGKYKRNSNLYVNPPNHEENFIDKFDSPTHTEFDVLSYQIHDYRPQLPDEMIYQQGMELWLTSDTSIKQLFSWAIFSLKCKTQSESYSFCLIRHWILRNPSKFFKSLRLFTKWTHLKYDDPLNEPISDMMI